MSSPTHSANTGRIILHIGTGSFHRAHQAWYLHRLRESGNEHALDWSIAAGNIRSDMNPTHEALAAQNGMYTLETVTPDGVRAYEHIRSIQHVLPWSPDHAPLIECGASRTCRIISFTVTESGYYLDSRDRLDVSHPDIAADLDGARTTIYGVLAAILDARRRADGGPVTLQCCDNLRHNGEKFRAGFAEFLERRNLAELKRWVDEHTTTPSAMVDRITPRPTPDIRPHVLAATGFDDRCPVMGESFAQWVIEDDFIAGRPAWESAGAELVDSVLPYEEAKIRILNATHSCIAWAGTLAGFEYIHEGTGDAEIARFAGDYITQDVIPSLLPSPVDLPRYRDVVLERFGNPDIRDTNERVAADGFTKLSGFIVPTLRDCFARGASPSATALLPALFLAFLARWADGTLRIPYRDSLLDHQEIRAMLASEDPVAVFCADRRVWGELASDSRLVEAVRTASHSVNLWLAARHGVHNRK
ncbi:D-arabinitol 4-dehydrogenase [Paraburkholderia susongensis]|uniref:D-arabinitol 4-dehydrogenase n=1 Tax=Paraburkholderia susongensis TaxID=1515439 RepID=A0A1X7M4W7_9BURK|nr:D-arabinitol 4-dehydrogenase [Paraburkholderia susongensis]SMG60522.1 D-arabinitol 4-dehydrogenase [Paraburkholderia susongensis]